MSYPELLDKIKRYCMMEERCRKNVYKKLLDYGMEKEKINSVIIKLMKDDFINEKRFAYFYSRGKFLINQWGKRKIEFELKKKRIHNSDINQALEEIDQDDYNSALLSLLKKKNEKIKKIPKSKKKQKLVNYFLSKGFELDLIWKNIIKLEKENLI
tara:strand:+ start:1730 stop:2197 length:468 start_codon:yes stop_codon:yes gene_type:complete